jgi:hypothetical protein
MPHENINMELCLFLSWIKSQGVSGDHVQYRVSGGLRAVLWGTTCSIEYLGDYVQYRVSGGLCAV